MADGSINDIASLHSLTSYGDYESAIDRSTKVSVVAKDSGRSISYDNPETLLINVIERFFTDDRVSKLKNLDARKIKEAGELRDYFYALRLQFEECEYQVSQNSLLTKINHYLKCLLENTTPPNPSSLDLNQCEQMNSESSLSLSAFQSRFLSDPQDSSHTTSFEACLRALPQESESDKMRRLFPDIPTPSREIAAFDDDAESITSSVTLFTSLGPYEDPNRERAR